MADRSKLPRITLRSNGTARVSLRSMIFELPQGGSDLWKDIAFVVNWFNGLPAQTDSPKRWQ